MDEWLDGWTDECMAVWMDEDPSFQGFGCSKRKLHQPRFQATIQKVISRYTNPNPKFTDGRDNLALAIAVHRRDRSYDVPVLGSLVLLPCRSPPCDRLGSDLGLCVLFSLR